MEKAVILAAATGMEMRAVVKGLGLAVPAPEVGEYAAARVRDIPVTLVVCGIGPLAAAYAAGRLAGEGALCPLRCRGLISFGIAGTYNSAAAPLGSVALATEEIWPEYGLATETGVDAVALGFPLAGKKDDTVPPPVWNALSLDPAKAIAAMGLNGITALPDTPGVPRVVMGPGVTVAGVSGTAARAAELASRYNALTENMESFPLALAARNAGVPFAEIRAVSNLVGDRGKEAWDIPASLQSLERAVRLLFAE